jgi:hypothetical protein
LKKNSLKIAIVFSALFLGIILGGCAESPDAQTQYCDIQNSSYGPVLNACFQAGSVQLNGAADFIGKEHPAYVSAVTVTCTKQEEPAPFILINPFGLLTPSSYSWTAEINPFEECTPDKYLGCKMDSDGQRSYCYGQSEEPPIVPPNNADPNGIQPEM